MGYDLHITRADEWSESEAHPIRLAEWLDYVGQDKDLKQEPYAEALSPSGETIRIPGEGLVLWLGHPDHTEKDVTWWFDWRSGEISVKNPDEPAISKMREIAQKLGARVQGDDGEYYDDGGPHHPEQSRPKPQGSWWRILFGR